MGSASVTSRLPLWWFTVLTRRLQKVTEPFRSVGIYATTAPRLVRMLACTYLPGVPACKVPSIGFGAVVCGPLSLRCFATNPIHSRTRPGCYETPPDSLSYPERLKQLSGKDIFSTQAMARGSERRRPRQLRRLRMRRFGAPMRAFGGQGSKMENQSSSMTKCSTTLSTRIHFYSFF
jgi:hypothetical protein